MCNKKILDEKKLKYCMEALDHINEGVIITDRTGTIVIYNKKLGEFEDLDKEEAVGRHLMDVYEWSVESSEHYQVLKTGKPIKEGNYRNITKLGKTNYLIANSFPIMDEDGIPEAVCSISRNVTSIREIYDRTMGLQSVNEKGGPSLENGTRFTFEDVVYESEAMKDLIANAKRAAMNKTSVLVYGETGTGKEMIVQGMHNAGSGWDQPFVALNCAALPESLLESLLFGTKKGAFTGAENTIGFFEQAGKGTLYLDEINSMPLNLQAKFLRAIQERKFRRVGDDRERSIDCKIISSVNVEPMRCVEEGQLRQDLYYRLSGVTLEIPPLRKRRDDIAALTKHFEHKYCAMYGKKDVTLDETVRETFIKYEWPGNVRELEHLIESAISLTNSGEELTLYNFPPYLRKTMYASNYIPEDAADMTLNEILYSVEKKAVKDALEKNGMNVSKAARSLGLCRQSMQYRINKLGLKNTEKK